MKPIFTFILLSLICSNLSAQVPYNALDFHSVKPYQHHFLYGINLGYYGDSWDDRALADIAAGNPAKNVDGVGVKSLRPPLPGYFVEFYGNRVRVNEFEHFKSLGIEHNTIMLGWPSDAQRETYDYGCGELSKMFKGMYLPIWDNGENGTPYNDDNLYAKYVYELVTIYKDYTKFWEIMNEPDFDIYSQAWLGADQPNNWWTNNPNPCALLNMKAPIFSYIRMLRISYDVIKTVDPEAYVCVGGIGYPSFLDALLRNTDNPIDGSVTAEYPHQGGAYFDVLSFHSYPMYKLGLWSNAANGFVYQRHSDAAIDVYLKDKEELEDVLLKYGFDGSQYPEKIWICTESNISRIRSENYIGSEDAQLNYVMKVQIISQIKNIKQHYLFVLGEPKTEQQSSDPFDFMGLYRTLEGTGPIANNNQYSVNYTKAGIGHRTLSKELLGYYYDETMTSQLALPTQIEGGAFKNNEGKLKYVLWAKTHTDQTEETSALYQFPESFDSTKTLIGVDWQANEKILNLNAIELNGTPLIIKSPDEVLSLRPKKNQVSAEPLVSYRLFPNPAQSHLQFEYRLLENETVYLQIIHSSGSFVQQIYNGVTQKAGLYQIPIAVTSLAKGVYYLQFSSEKKYQIIPFIKQ